VQSVQRMAVGWTTDGSQFESRDSTIFSFLHVGQTEFVPDGLLSNSFLKFLHGGKETET
jgi:hypothetical protein